MNEFMNKFFGSKDPIKETNKNNSLNTQMNKTNKRLYPEGVNENVSPIDLRILKEQRKNKIIYDAYIFNTAVIDQNFRRFTEIIKNEKIPSEYHIFYDHSRSKYNYASNCEKLKRYTEKLVKKHNFIGCHVTYNQQHGECQISIEIP